MRGKLERAVREARDIAEDAARAAVRQLGVGEAKVPLYLTDEQKTERKKLRAHGRQLGDLRDETTQNQQIDRLVEEVAYQHWHRMLFARFLAENNLLMYPDPVQPIPITLAECEDLAAEEGARNGWELAARFAAKMLPQIFRPESPIFLLALPPEHERRLEQLLAGLPAEVFFASDSLGWVYQFWQAKKKDEINASEVKIGARELPVVTQLFTEPYMVSFLLDNSLGAWWAARRLSEDDLRNAKDEEELRRKAALPGVPLDYLRFVRGEDGRWTPAAGTFEGWPQNLKELKVLDPCCGSGHFLVAALPMLASMRMELEGLSAGEAVDAVLRENLHGLEIDPRCVELAAFALGFAAWRYPGAGGYRMLPELNLACSGLSISAGKEEWQALAKINSNNNINDNSNLEIVLVDLYDQFKDAPLLGSLINPKLTLFNGNILGLSWEDISPLLTKALSSEADMEKVEMGVVAQGLAKAAQLLARRYHLVITNVPYLARGKQSEKLKEFCEDLFNEAKNDLATVFLDRCLQFCKEGGSSSSVLPQNWLFLTSYRKFREQLLKKERWNLIARLGPQAFQTPMWDFNVQLITLTRSHPPADRKEVQAWSQQAQMISGLDVFAARTAGDKDALLRSTEIKRVGQAQQLENPDSRLAFVVSLNSSILSDFAESSHGQGSFDSFRFTFNFWEIPIIAEGWIRQQSSAKKTNLFEGCHYAFRWEDGRGDLWKMMEAKKLQGYSSGKWRAGTGLFGKKGILINQMDVMPATLYLGSAFDENASVIIPKNKENIEAIWCFCSSKGFHSLIKDVDQSLKVTCKTLVKVPFDLERWQKVAAEKYPSGLPKPYSDDPTQWIFHGHPARSDEPLQVAMACLLGYRWPAELDMQMELSDEARAWVKRCDELHKFEDDDGIVCIPPVRGESAAADYLQNLLAAAYGPDWSTDKLSELLKAADHAGKTLESWLRDKFFLQHCKLFHHRPFIWHIWDGLYDGFAALVNYHRLDAKLLESLIFVYLGDWITRQKDDQKKGVDGAAEKLAAAELLKKRLELILEGEQPYDIFVRWKPLEAQPVGWSPDLNDGVRLNIRPFMSVPDVGRKGAGVLREKLNINWNKDRGKDVESAPWYHLFNGDRINDHHLKLEEKKKARGR